MTFRRSDLFFGGIPDIDEFSRKVADPEKIANIIKILNLI
jgi:hypothetical protein